MQEGWNPIESVGPHEFSRLQYSESNYAATPELNHPFR